MNAIYLRLVVVLVLLGSAFGAGYTVRGWEADADALTAARANTAAVAAAEAKKSAAERQYAQLQASAATDRQKLIQERDDALTKARSVANTRGLYVRADCPSGNNVSGIAAPPSGSNDGTVVRLSRDTAEYLIARAGLADTVTDQLRECQVTIKNYLAVIGATEKGEP